MIASVSGPETSNDVPSDLVELDEFRAGAWRYRAEDGSRVTLRMVFDQTAGDNGVCARADLAVPLFPRPAIQRIEKKHQALQKKTTM